MDAIQFYADHVRTGRVSVPQIPVTFICFNNDDSQREADNFEAVCFALPRTGETVLTPIGNKCIVIGVSYEFTSVADQLQHMARAIVVLRPGE